MALKITKTQSFPTSVDANGVTIERDPIPITDVFYIKVLRVYGSKDKMKVDAHFKGDVLNYFEVYEFTPDVSEGAENFIRQAYLHMKTLDEFSGAEDV
jgi:hypothetical protein